jgi:HIP---CoA ligase
MHDHRRLAGLDPETTVFGHLSDAAARYGERIALIDERGSLTYSEYLLQARRFGAELERAGVRHGDRVAMLLPNSVQYAVAVLGAASLGAVGVLANARSSPRELAHIFDDCEPAAVVAWPETKDHLPLDSLVGLCRGRPSLRRVFVIEHEGGAGEGLVTGFPGPADGDHVDGDESSGPGPDDPVIIIYTSGTTGTPKGAALSHRNLLCSVQGYAKRLGLREDDRLSIFTPMHHAGGTLNGVLTSLWTRATGVILDRFQADSAMAMLKRHGVTVYLGVPTMLAYHIQSAKDGATIDLPQLRAVLTGGSSVTRELIRDIGEWLAPDVVHVLYGLTEAGMVTVTEAIGDTSTFNGSVGAPTEVFEIRLVDEQRREIPNGQVGEVAVRGCGVFQGYWNRGQATRDSLDDEGWLYTGDVGSLDAAGELSIVGRIKDMYIRGGTNVYPAEVERVLEQHPGVLMAAVVGRPHPVLGETGCAFVVPRTGEALDEGEVVAFARRHLAAFKVPDELHIRVGLPLTATGKVHKAELRAALPDDHLAITVEKEKM